MLRALIPFLVVLSAFPGGAPALPAPMSKGDLLLKSDLGALVRVWSVTCVGVTKDPQTEEALPTWKADAELIEVVKGNEPKGGTVDIAFHAIPAGALGSWTVYYYPGEMVWTASRGQGWSLPPFGGMGSAAWWRKPSSPSFRPRRARRPNFTPPAPIH